VRLAAHHCSRYFRFEIGGARDADLRVPYRRIYERAARVLFDRVPVCRLADLDDFLAPWKGSHRARECPEREAVILVE
jgi:hypothetical protein